MKMGWVSAAAAAVVVELASTAAFAQQALILVRHAELQGSAMANPKNVPLSAEGKARAQRLAAMLKDSGVAAIYVTDFARTQQTAQPLSKELGETFTVVPKSEPQNMVAQLRKNHPGQVVLLVGHTDTLPGLIKALGVASEVKIEAQDYGNVYIVTPKAEGAPTFLHLRY